MLKGTSSSDHGETSSTKIFNPGPEMKPLNKASIPAWSVDHSLRMLTHRHCYGVVTTICLSATSSLPRTQRSRTRRLGSASRVPSARGAEGPGLRSSPSDFLFCLAEFLANWKLRLNRLSSRHHSNDDECASAGCGPRTMQG